MTPNVAEWAFVEVALHAGFPWALGNWGLSGVWGSSGPWVLSRVQGSPGPGF